MSAQEAREVIARLVAATMRGAFALEAPLRVSLEAGPTWADLASLPSASASPSGAL